MSTHTNMHWYIPIPTSNIRLLCLTYTFSPFIRLIRLFWKKWRRKGKVRDTVVTGTNAILHSAPTTRVTAYGACWKAGTPETHSDLSHTDFCFGFIFNFLPVPWALHLPPGPTASIKKEWEIMSYHVIDYDWRTMVYRNLLEGVLVCSCIWMLVLSYMQAATFSHTNYDAY